MLSSYRVLLARASAWCADSAFFISNPIYLRFAKGVSWSLIGAVISQGLSLVASIPVARMLGPSGYGELGIIQSTLALFTLVTGTSLGLTATKYVAELYKTDRERTSTIIGLTSTTALMAGGGLAILLYIEAPYLAHHVLGAPNIAPSLRLASLVFFLNGFNGAQIGALAGFQAFRKIANVNIWRGLVNFPAMLISVRLWGLEGAVLSLAVVAGVGVLLSQLALREETKRQEIHTSYQKAFSETRVLLRFTLPTIFSGFMVVPLTWWANVVLVNQPNGYVEMGIFNATNQWRTALMFLPSIIGQPILPMLAELYGRRSSNEYRRLLFLNLKLVLMSTIIPATIISICANLIMNAYGFKNKAGALVLIVLSFAAVLSALANVIGSVIASMGKMWQGLGLNAIWGTVFIIFFLNHRNGASGLAYAYLISYMVHFFIVSAYSLFVLNANYIAQKTT